MKLLISVVAAVVLVALIVALGQGTGSTEPSAVRPTSTDAGRSADRGGADDGEAAEVMTQVAAAYRAASSLRDSMDIVYVTPRGEQTVQYEVALAGGERMAMEIPKYRIVAHDETVYVLRDGIDYKYLEVPLRGNPFQTYRAISGDRPVPMHFAMVWTDDAGRYLPSLTMGQLTNPRYAGVERDAAHPYRRDGKAWEVSVEADNGSGRLYIDPETKMLAATELDFAGQDGRDYGLQIKFTPTVVDAEPEMIAFDPAGKTKVGQMSALDQVSVGEPMPDFRLMTADGKILRKRHILGNVTVLDFWATWCGPCKMALPLLEEFHTWAEQSGQPVKVYAVDVWERFPSATQKMSAANNYWNTKDFTMPLVFDLDDSLVTTLGFPSIPTTIVVDAEGKIAKIHRGYDPRMKQTLQNDVQAVLAAQ